MTSGALEGSLILQALTDCLGTTRTCRGTQKRPFEPVRGGHAIRTAGLERKTAVKDRRRAATGVGDCRRFGMGL